MRRTRFITWCKRDPNDDRKINYTFIADGKTERFTSEDTVSFAMMTRIRYAWVKEANLINNEWYVTIYED